VRHSAPCHQLRFRSAAKSIAPSQLHPPKNQAVVKYAQSVYPDEQDFIVMGDLNADSNN
jgi:hypothetical protein